MPGLLYTHPDDDYVIQAALDGRISTTATPVNGYPIESLGNEDPSFPCKVSETTFPIVVDLGSSQPVGLICIGHANFDAALPLVVELDDDAGFGSPVTINVTTPDYQEDRMPTQIEVDVETLVGVQTVQYVRIRNTSANSVPVSVGIVSIMPAWRDLGVDFQVGGSAIDDEDHPGIENRTDAGISTFYPYGNREQRLSGDILDTNDDDDELVRRWNRSARGKFRPFWVNFHLPIAEPHYVKFDSSRLPRKRLFRFEESGETIHGYSLAFTVMGRGLIPEPSAV